LSNVFPHFAHVIFTSLTYPHLVASSPRGDQDGYLAWLNRAGIILNFFAGLLLAPHLIGETD
jgi:hypothetical protein